MENTQLISQADYDYFTSKAVELRSPEQQVQIEAFEAAMTDAIEHTTDAPVVASIAPDLTHACDDDTEANIGSNEQSDTSVWSVNSVQQDTEIQELVTNIHAVFEHQLPAFKEDKHKQFITLSALAASLVKWTQPFEVAVRTNEQATTYPVSLHIANTIGLVCFKHHLSERAISKEVKLAQMAKKYLPLCIVPFELQRKTSVEGENTIVQGAKFYVHSNAMKYVHNDVLKIANLEDIFQTESIGAEPLTEDSTAIRGIRYKQQLWVEGNEQLVVELIEKLQAERPSQIEETTYKAWSGVLALALLLSKECYEQMKALMVEQVGTKALENKVKLACALSIVVPEYEQLVSRFGVQDEVIGTKLLQSLLKAVSLAEATISSSFDAIGLKLADHKGGFTMKQLKDVYTPLLDFSDVRVQNYLQTLKRPVAANSALQEAA